MAQDIVVGLDQCWAGHRAARLGLGAAAAGRAEKAGVFFAQGHDHLRLAIGGKEVIRRVVEHDVDLAGDLDQDVLAARALQEDEQLVRRAPEAGHDRNQNVVLGSMTRKRSHAGKMSVGPNFKKSHSRRLHGGVRRRIGFLSASDGADPHLAPVNYHRQSRWLEMMHLEGAISGPNGDV